MIANDRLRLRRRLIQQISLITSGELDPATQLILSRNLLEGDAILNFLSEKKTRQRVELFKCYRDFAWRSHLIYQGSPRWREHRFLLFLQRTAARYPYGFSKYYRLVKRRLCRELRAHRQVEGLKIMTSDKASQIPRQFCWVARYMAHHLITKLPFPYRVTFGKSITYFVIKYSGVDRRTYWLLADLSHGILTLDPLTTQFAHRLVNKIVRIVGNGL